MTGFLWPGSCQHFLASMPTYMQRGCDAAAAWRVDRFARELVRQVRETVDSERHVEGVDARVGRVRRVSHDRGPVVGAALMHHLAALVDGQAAAAVVARERQLGERRLVLLCCSKGTHTRIGGVVSVWKGGLDAGEHAEAGQWDHHGWRWQS